MHSGDSEAVVVKEIGLRVAFGERQAVRGFQMPPRLELESYIVCVGFSDCSAPAR